MKHPYAGRMSIVPQIPVVTVSPTQNERQPKLLDRLREALRTSHYNRRTEETYRHWVKRFVYFHKMRHPKEMAEPEINAFLTHPAVKEHVHQLRIRPSALCSFSIAMCSVGRSGNWAK